MKIGCVPAEQVFGDLKNTITVQQALSFLIMVPIQDQENEHTEDSTTVRVEMRSRQCDDGAWGTAWVQHQRATKYLVRMRPRLLEVSALGSPRIYKHSLGTFAAERSVYKVGQQRFELLSSGNAIMDLQIIS